MSDFKFSPEIEIISAADGVRRRHWSDEDKLKIVEESFVGHRQATATARRHGICRSLLTVWRRLYRGGELGGSRLSSFVPVSVSNEIPAPRSTPVETFASLRDTQVEIALPNGRRLIVPVGVNPEALARLLSVVDSQ